MSIRQDRPGAYFNRTGFTEKWWDVEVLDHPNR